MGCDFKPQLSHSQLSLRLTEVLKKLTYIYAAYCIVKLFIFPNNFLNDLIIIFLLFMTFKQCSFSTGYFVLFFLSFDFLFESLYFLQIIQNFILGISYPNSLFIFVLKSINIFFYFMLLKYTFLCSREYKALTAEQSGINNNSYRIFNDDNERNNSEEKQRLFNGNENKNGESNKGYVPFSGKGSTWGS